MRLPLPRTLTGQLVAITLLVVLVAQLANLIALISERRLAYVRVEVRGMIDDIVDAAAQLPEPPPTRLPYLVRP
ncbi:MAG TPA: histidine kinase, partial [Gammaproteobacteria bacterium]|nr:histidine kinase [Gammaproteobacteria bacterium]